MALKPLFYMLAKHGPWSHHIRVKNTSVLEEVEAWLISSGKKENVDYEVLIQAIEHRHTKKTFVPFTITSSGGRTSTMPLPQQQVEPILFLNDLGAATYIKLTWGGR